MTKFKALKDKPLSGIYPNIIKRCLDILLAVLLSIPALILVGVAAILIRLETGEGAFFIQVRPGLRGKPFRLYKLRSMISQTEKDGKPLSDMERVTITGRVIRMLSIDELPQLLNILKGDMSFIGPRPLLMQYLPLYNEEQARRHLVRPGVSGWAQVNGRNALSWEEKFELDAWYVDHISLGLDLKIVWMTIVNILKRQGINAGVDEIMGLFTGSSNVPAREMNNQVVE
jgi:lipopolysaccharide/colanic/teichoic acid biosynthesis glycosyltransferase